MRQKFTGYEADGETGLSFAQARYQSAPAQGRFTSVDPLQPSADVADPQSFNRYTYVNNDPVNHVDPTGLRLEDMGVYQTNNAQDARIAEQQSLQDFQVSMNAQYAARQGGSVSYAGNRASFMPGWVSHLESYGGNVTASAVVNAPGVAIPTDVNDLAMFAVLLGEASTPGEGSWGPDESGQRAYKNPSRTLSDDDVFGEMIYMVFVVNNRLIDWGKAENFKSWKDVIEREPNKQFLGFAEGLSSIQNRTFDSNRAQIALAAIKSFHEQPIPRETIKNFHFWKGIKQPSKVNPGRMFITARGNATRIANTDFSVKENRY